MLAFTGDWRGFCRRIKLWRLTFYIGLWRGHQMPGLCTGRWTNPTCICKRGRHVLISLTILLGNGVFNENDLFFNKKFWSNSLKKKNQCSPFWHQFSKNRFSMHETGFRKTDFHCKKRECNSFVLFVKNWAWKYLFFFFLGKTIIQKLVLWFQTKLF